jgi:elongation factor G
VTVPESYIGDLTGDLSGRRAQVRGTDTLRPGVALISAQVPLSELENFPSRLKSITAGEGSYTLEFSHYDPAPGVLQQKLVAAHKPQAEEA